MSESKVRVALGCDHAGYQYKEEIKKILTERGYIIKDFGTNSTEPVDYPDYVHPVADSIDNNEEDFGILICGSGNGVAMTANKHTYVRAALCWKDEIAELARKHNDSNVMCISARYTELDEAKKMVITFLNTQFEGGRHSNRVNKITNNNHNHNSKKDH